MGGIPARIANQLGLRGESVIGGYLLVDLRRLAGRGVGERIVAHQRYLPDDYRERTSRASTASLRISEPCRGRDVLVLSNLLPGLNEPFEIESEHPDDDSFLIAQTLVSRYYTCPDRAVFSFRINALDASMVDAFIIEGSARDSATPDSFAQ
jgi:hypothetical protein